MKLHFLGSSASEGIPNPFCLCEYCMQSRKTKGKDLRTHSSVIIDDTLLIDIAPEFSQQILRDGLDATKITDLLFTHTHPDHFNVGELFSRMENYAFGVTHPLQIFGNDRAINGCATVLPGYSNTRFAFHRLVPFVTIESHGYKITPLLANHAEWEQCYVYLVEKDQVSIFYGHDSGWFPELTWQWLAGKSLDLCVLECTYGFNGNDRSDNHMSLESVFAAQEKLKNMGCIESQSQLVVSHISHTGKLLHNELVDACQERNITVAYDGLVLHIN